MLILNANYLKKLPTGLSNPVITVADVSYALGSQKRRKAAGPDGLPMEGFMFAGQRLHVLLGILFDLCIRFSYVLQAFF